MQEIMYVKTIEKYEDLHNDTIGIENFFQKIIFGWKSFRHIPVIQQGKWNVCYFPVQKEMKQRTLDRFFGCLAKKLKSAYQLVLSKELLTQNATIYAEKYGMPLFRKNDIKKLLLLKALEKLDTIQPKLENRSVAVLCNEATPLNLEIICELATQYKALKIVSKTTADFRKLEDELYHQLGIAIQLSHSYQKSILHTNRIINLDFKTAELNEYHIDAHAVILNTSDPVEIKSKSFQGIVINDYEIQFSHELEQELFQKGIENDFTTLELYAGVVNWKQEEEYEIINDIKKKQIRIENFIGNHGTINIKEFKM